LINIGKYSFDRSPEDIRWDPEDHGIINQGGWAPSAPLRRQPSNGEMAGASRVRGRLSTNVNDYAPPQNGITRIIDHIGILNPENIVIEVIIDLFRNSDIKRQLHTVFPSQLKFSQHWWRGCCPIQICMKLKRQGSC
jgi:hypothetical protein